MKAWLQEFWGVAFGTLVALFLVFDALGVWQFYLPGSSTQVPPTIPAALAILFAMGLNARKIAELKTKVERLEEQRPDIDVEIREGTLHEVFLAVTNHGGRGELEAQITLDDNSWTWLHGDRPNLPMYQGYWQQGAGPRTQIPQGHSDLLKIGGVALGRNTAVANLWMAYCDPGSTVLKVCKTSLWVVGYPETTSRPALLLQVTITSHPPLRHGPFTKTYRMSPDTELGLQEVTPVTP